jgi:hypothetical protein
MSLGLRNHAIARSEISPDFTEIYMHAWSVIKYVGGARILDYSWIYNGRINVFKSLLINLQSFVREYTVNLSHHSEQ